MVIPIFSFLSISFLSYWFVLIAVGKKSYLIQNVVIIISPFAFKVLNELFIIVVQDVLIIFCPFVYSFLMNGLSLNNQYDRQVLFTYI